MNASNPSSKSEPDRKDCNYHRRYEPLERPLPLAPMKNSYVTGPPSAKTRLAASASRRGRVSSMPSS